MDSSTDKPSSPPHMPDIPPLASLTPPNEGILGSLLTLPSVASSGSSMETAQRPSHLRKGPMEALVIPHQRPSNFPPCWPILGVVTLSNPILPPCPRLFRVRPTLLFSIQMSGARKRLRRSTGVRTSGSKFPCVSGPASRTRAGRSKAASPSTVPNSFVPKTRSRIKPFSSRKLLKGKMGFPPLLILV
ncbi:hypothetical protein HAX54_033220 [Datura stramonium]|uniref:Uncharacterized protein n=1 Tax=Datura stramonium TaxID=4076 RepID=A0ABS8VF03_DATST|nr:hypothetical protein [Datura stramonium]